MTFGPGVSIHASVPIDFWLKLIFDDHGAARQAMMASYPVYRQVL